MIKDNIVFDCKYDEVLFAELNLLVGNNINYTPGDFNEDASIELNDTHHIQLGKSYVILWIKEKELFNPVFSDNYKSIFEIEYVINAVAKLKLF
jgi:hypothetical protein